MTQATGAPRLTPDVASLWRAWRADPARTIVCPACGSALTVTDRSARPYAEWYNFRCASGDFDETLHIPLGGPAP